MVASNLVTVSVAIASVGRPDSLRTSLRHLQEQLDLADEIIVVAQSADVATQAVARECGARLAIVESSGLALAVQTGIAEARSDVVAFVDDDAEALPDWVMRIRNAFSRNPRLGILGGRDNVDGDRTSGSSALTVGTLRRGKLVGNHHRGLGAARPAEHVKGANMSMRSAPARRVPLARLVSGTGAQARNEFILSLGITAQGFYGLYDPGVQVDHFPATRAEGDERTRFTRQRTSIVRHNEVVALALYRSKWALWAFMIRAATVGDRTCYGLAYLVIRLLQREPASIDRFFGSLDGMRTGIRSAREFRSTRFAEATDAPSN